MLRRLLDRFRPATGAEDALYDSIVAAARQARLYAEWGVPDTPAGRIEMVALHTAIATRALMALGPEGAARARSLNERFVTDMDDNMREIGVGDLTVPKKVKKAAASVYDRVAAIDAVAQAGTDVEKAEAAGRLIELEHGGDRLDRRALGRYFYSLVNRLSDGAGATLMTGKGLPLIADAI